MLYVGIDVAKNKHDIAVLTEEGEIITRNFRFKNDYLGFHELKGHLEQHNAPMESIRIALEEYGVLRL